MGQALPIIAAAVPLIRETASMFREFGSGKSVVERVIVENPDPKTLEMLESTRKELAKYKEQFSNPEKFAQVENEMFNKFLESITKCKFRSVKISRSSPYEKHVAFLGPISVGKSSLINAIAGSKVCQTGMGETTRSVEMKFQSNNTCIWDFPGNNKYYNYLDIDNLSFLKALDKAVILFNSSPKDVERMIRVCHKLRISFICVRTFCDNFDVDSDDLSVEDTLEEDKKEITGMIGGGDGVNVKVFGVSSRYGGTGNRIFDWEEFLSDIVQ